MAMSPLLTQSRTVVSPANAGWPRLVGCSQTDP